jgi:8-oxo-dGTP diphosphatase
MDSKQIYDYILKIQSIAKIGLIYSKDPYAITNYQEINDLSMKFLEEFLEIHFDRPNYFARDVYPTPNISVRTVIFNDDKTKVLLVREVKEQAYSLPGGWCDIYDSPSETAINECSQEAGADIEVVRLIGVMNRTPFKKPTSVPEYVLVFEGKIIGKLHEHEYETDDVNFFEINNLPEICKKVTKEEVLRMINAGISGEIIFD